MNKKDAVLPALGLAFSLGLAGAASAQPEFNANLTIENPLGGRDTQITVPVDCDLLGPNGERTLEFVKQFGIWGHIENETSIDRALRHLSLHGLDEERINNVQRYCIENF